MTREEMTDLAKFIGLVCPQQKMPRETVIAWYEILGQFGYEECRNAVIAVKHSQPFVDVSDIIREASRPKGRPYERTVPEALEMANQRELNSRGVASAVSALWGDALAKGMQANAQRRARVLRHPDLAARLCQPPLGYSSPDHWNGFVPPRFLPADASGRVRPNDSPERGALAEISAEAAAREVAQDPEVAQVAASAPPAPGDDWPAGSAGEAMS